MKDFTADFTSLPNGTIIMAAPNGASKTKAIHPNLPLTVEECVAEAKACQKAGAAMIHVHTRAIDQSDEAPHVLDAGRSRELITAIEEATDNALIVQTTTECVGRYTPQNMREFLRELKPKACSIAIAELIPDPTEEAEAGKFLHWLNETACLTQFILYDAEQRAYFADLQARGIVPNKNPWLLFVLGRYTPGQRSTPDDLQPFLDAHAATGDGSSHPWSFCAFGPQEAACAERAIENGGHVRVGFENNIYLPSGEPAASTADLVALAAQAARAHNRPPLTADDIRAAIATS